MPKETSTTEAAKAPEEQPAQGLSGNGCQTIVCVVADMMPAVLQGVAEGIVANPEAMEKLAAAVKSRMMRKPGPRFQR